MHQAPFVRGDLPVVNKSYQPLDLFLFSAATWNAHRVHYDQEYSVQVEGHQNLLVHGPLQAVQMYQVLIDALVDEASIRAVDYRHLHALHVGEEVAITGRLTAVDERTGSATFEMWVERAADRQRTTTGTATVQLAPRLSGSNT